MDLLNNEEMIKSFENLSNGRSRINIEKINTSRQNTLMYISNICNKINDNEIKNSFLYLG